MKYIASKIVQRAFDLADIANTDFLTHEEVQAYLNDAWKGVYQWLINKGDKQFVREVQLSPSGIGNITEYYIPDDMYQILSLKDMPSGRIIPRHTESESISSNTYEIVNDKIRLYGVTSHNLVLTYYTNPVFITYPDKTLYPEVTGTILSSAGNTVLYNTGVIRNVVTGETLGAITITGGRTYVLGNGHVFSYSGSSIKYESYSGTSLLTATLSGTPTTLYDENFNVCYQVGKGVVTRRSKVIATNPRQYKALVILRDAIIYQDTAGHLIVSDDEIDAYRTEETYTGVSAIPFTDKSFIVGYNGEYHQIVLKDDYSLSDIQLDHINPFNPVRMLKYGLLESTGSDYKIISWFPDTEFNFPNELYVSLLSADLGLRFLTKQNADSSGLNNLYTNMQTQFMNSLSQDGGYTRIKNIYRG